MVPQCGPHPGCGSDRTLDVVPQCGPRPGCGSPVWTAPWIWFPSMDRTLDVVPSVDRALDVVPQCGPRPGFGSPVWTAPWMWFPSVDRALDVVPQCGLHPANKINERKIIDILKAMKLKGELIKELECDTTNADRRTSRGANRFRFNGRLFFGHSRCGLFCWCSDTF